MSSRTKKMTSRWHSHTYFCSDRGQKSSIHGSMPDGLAMLIYSWDKNISTVALIHTIAAIELWHLLQQPLSGGFRGGLAAAPRNPQGNYCVWDWHLDLLQPPTSRHCYTYCHWWGCISIIQYNCPEWKPQRVCTNGYSSWLPLKLSKQVQGLFQVLKYVISNWYVHVGFLIIY